MATAAGCGRANHPAPDGGVCCEPIELDYGDNAGKYKEYAVVGAGWARSSNDCRSDPKYQCFSQPHLTRGIDNHGCLVNFPYTYGCGQTSVCGGPPDGAVATPAECCGCPYPDDW